MYKEVQCGNSIHTFCIPGFQLGRNFLQLYQIILYKFWFSGKEKKEIMNELTVGGYITFSMMKCPQQVPRFW